MALLNVNPTRMVLLDLKKRVKSANRGHKLLKDKQDGLMKKFMEIIKEAKVVREEVEEKLGKGFDHLTNASMLMQPEMVETALKECKSKVELEVSTKNVMSVHIPVFDSILHAGKLNYGFLQTSGELDGGVKILQKLLPTLIKLAQIEKSAEALAVELELTRRRVNALEHKVIPDLKETVKFIKMKLGEAERSEIVTKMVIKDKIEAELERERMEKKALAAV